MNSPSKSGSRCLSVAKDVGLGSTVGMDGLTKRDSGHSMAATLAATIQNVR